MLRPLVNERFQGLFHSPPGVLFTFPSQYWSSIGLPSIFSLTGWSPLIPTVFLVSRRTQDTTTTTRSCPYWIITLYDVHFHTLPVQSCHRSVVLQPRHCRHNTGLGSFLFAHHYSGNRFFFLFLQVLRCFSSLGMLLLKVTGLQPAGFPHSDTCGSIRVCQSPQIFAAYRVLPRLWKPRHPPFALIYFVLNHFSKNYFAVIPLFMKL